MLPNVCALLSKVCRYGRVLSQNNPVVAGFRSEAGDNRTPLVERLIRKDFLRFCDSFMKHCLFVLENRTVLRRQSDAFVSDAGGPNVSVGLNILSADLCTLILANFNCFPLRVSGFPLSVLASANVESLDTTTLRP